jgi:2-(1,2-epoxy-1,2-dihydrophenyl)acetyl-CoA isomerase
VTDSLLQERAGGVLWLTLNRPERKNAVSPDLRDALIDALAAAEKDEEVRCAVLTGAGDAFCTGVDLATGAASQPPGPDGRPDAQAVTRATHEGMHRLAAAIWTFDKPIIAAVNGVAAGAGAQFALSCDLVLAAESARFIEIFARRGLVIDSAGSWLLPRLVGLARAKELVFLAESLSAMKAERFGLVNRVVPDPELRPLASAWAERLAASATRALAESKRLLNDSFGRTHAEALDAEAEAQGRVSQTDDFVEGVASFMQKRDPEFKGR